MSNLIPNMTGIVVKGTEIGYHFPNKFISHACRYCGKVRWVMLRKGSVPAHTRCNSCMAKHRGGNGRNWKGGRTLNRGYVYLILPKDSFFLPMARTNGYVAEHRLMIARSLGRCLHSWEIVHHKNHIRDDNRIENLQLVSDDRHKQITILEQQINRLEAKVGEQGKQIKLFQWQLKQGVKV